ncbi:hypothetical protein Ancab_037811 [Ancistrocladus abbreviatus]
MSDLLESVHKLPTTNIKQIRSDLVSMSLVSLRSFIVVCGWMMKLCYPLDYSKLVIDDYDYVFSENGLVAHKDGKLIGTQSLKLFLGEEKLKGGNDHEIFESERTIGHTVTSPEDTRKQCVELFLVKQD